MDSKEMTEILEKAVQALFANQPTILNLTSETQQTEWNLAHHLANEIHKFFPKLDYDVDIIKVNLGRKRPDIVFHTRGSHKDNLLVVEVKRDGSAADLKDDLEKIREYWFSDRLRYRFGAVINLTDDKQYQIQVVSSDFSK